MAPRRKDEPQDSSSLSGEARAQLTAAMAHEVRNPLNSIAIHVELMEARIRGGRVPASEAEALNRSLVVLAAEVDRIDRRLEDYLRIAGPGEPQLRAASLARVIRDCVDRQSALATRRQVRVVAAGDARARIDVAGIGQAIEAVLQNAIEASPTGAEVTVRAIAGSGRFTVEVADTGEGIASDALPRLFQLGFTTRPGHIGVGLAVAKQIVRGHGGSIVAESAGPGQGALVRIDLHQQ